MPFSDKDRARQVIGLPAIGKAVVWRAHEYQV